jgi:hypothetical protein
MYTAYGELKLLPVEIRVGSQPYSKSSTAENTVLLVLVIENLHRLEVQLRAMLSSAVKAYWYLKNGVKSAVPCIFLLNRCPTHHISLSCSVLVPVPCINRAVSVATVSLLST